MAKIHTYGSMRTAPAEYIATDAESFKVGDLAVVTNGKVVAAESNPTYLVIGKVNNGIVPVTAILDDMVLESSEAIEGFTKVAEDRYRK